MRMKEYRRTVPISVHIVADSRAKLGATSGMPDHEYDVTAELLGTGATGYATNEAVVVNVDLRVVENIETLKGMLPSILRAPKRVFVVDQSTRLATVQAYALGATHVLVSPLKPNQLLETLSNPKALPGGSTKVLLSGEKIASEGADSLSAMFRAAAGGFTIDVRRHVAPAMLSPTTLPSTVLRNG
ncbi:hypothetical protein [Bradyrhizobium sp. USDA 4473]